MILFTSRGGGAAWQGGRVWLGDMHGRGHPLIGGMHSRGCAWQGGLHGKGGCA